MEMEAAGRSFKLKFPVISFEEEMSVGGGNI